MAVFEITQRLMSVSPEYEVRREKDRAIGPEQIVKGELMTSSPYLRLQDAKSKTVIATLEGNATKTRFQIRGLGHEELALLNFPAIDVRNAFTMSVSGRGYYASGDVVAVKHVFECKDNDGRVVLVLSKDPSIRDRFVLETRDEAAIPQDVAVLVAVAVHSRFYEGPRRSSDGALPVHRL